MPKEIIVCCDGTGNSIEASDLGAESAKTNPQIIYELLTGHEKSYPGLAPISIIAGWSNHAEGWQAYRTKLASGNERYVYYDRGLGSPSLNKSGEKYALGWNPLNNLRLIFSKLREVRWQTLASGIMRNVEQAYRFISEHYEAGDKVYLFGFSRGSYTLLLLVNAIHHLGLIDKSKFQNPNIYKQELEHAFKLYRTINDDHADLSQHAAVKGSFAHTTPQLITFLGLFDTVRGLVAERVHDDAKLSSIVKTGRHAVAIDERRGIFKPQLWIAHADTDSQQLWFPGVHCDVGGGYVKRGLADIALHWMLSEAQKEASLEIEQDFLEQLEKKLDPKSPQHDSLNTPIKYLVEWDVVTKEYRRPLCTNTRESIHHSAIKRFGEVVLRADQTYTYKPSNLAHTLATFLNGIGLAMMHDFIDQQSLDKEYDGWWKKIPDADQLSDAGDDSSLVRNNKRRRSSCLHC